MSHMVMFKPHRIALVLIDAALLAVCWVVAYMVRFEFAIPHDDVVGDYALQMRLLLPWVVLSQLVLFLAFNLYKGILRYAGTTELKAIAGATAVNLFLWVLFDVWVQGQDQFLDMPLAKYHVTFLVLRVPYGVLLVYSLAAMVATGGFRFSRRLWLEGISRNEADGAPRTLLVGAGDLADSVLRQISQSPAPAYNIVAIVTRVRERVGLRLQGLKVVGMLDEIPHLLGQHRIEHVLIALEHPSPAMLSEVVRTCETAKAKFSIVPSITDIAGGKVEVSPVREVEIDDLLGRAPVDVKQPAGRSYLKGQTVLVTGAGGSIGSELCRQILADEPARVLLLGKGENSIHEVLLELSRQAPSMTILPIIADVRDHLRIRQVFDQYKPHVVFHAAAHKHVPLMEEAPGEAIKNNLLGTTVVAYHAHRTGAQKFLLISTDKAVRPTSVMGATKRLGETVIFSLAKESKTIFLAVRFGNVLGSRGSVIPTFRRQIEAGGPVTVTHPDMTRYFMTIPEAVSLVRRAGASQKSGTLFLLDMGKPVRILDLAKNLISLSGLTVGKDIQIQFTGLRPGEKLTEELLTQEEGATATEIGKVFEAKPSAAPDWAACQEMVAELGDLAESGDATAMKRRLRDLVPDYHPLGLAEPTAQEVLDPIRESISEEIKQRREEMEAELAQEEALLRREPTQQDLFDLPTPAPVPGGWEPPDGPSADRVAEERPKVELEDMATPLALPPVPSVAAPDFVLVVDCSGCDESILSPFREVAATLYPNCQMVLLGTGTDRDNALTGKSLNAALRAAPQARWLLRVDPRVRPNPRLVEEYGRVMESAPECPLVYGDHVVVSPDGERQAISLFDHEGCPHERFDFGPVQMLRVASIGKVGGFREDMDHAFDYDMHLKLMELGPFLCHHEALYEVLLPAPVADSAGLLRSPGKGPLGGFSYIFYPEGMEREVTSVFEDALKRRGAWLESPTRQVDYADMYITAASVVIPVLNREKYIGNAIEKVLAGTFQDFEILVVDNGSTDRTREVVAEIADRDQRVKLLAGKGATIAAALNQGIREAQGKYICQLDSDDEYAPMTLERMISHLESHPNCGLAISYYRLMNEQGVVIEDVAPITHSGYTRNQILRRDGAGALRVFPKVVLEEFGLYDEEHYGNFGEDYDMVLKVGEVYDVDRVQEVLYFYRRHDDNTDVTREPLMKYRNKNRARQEALARRIEANRRRSANGGQA